MRKITVEEHFISHRFIEVVKGMLAKPADATPDVSIEEREELKGFLSLAEPKKLYPVSEESAARLFDTGEGRLRIMDEAGIDMQVISFIPGLGNLGSVDSATLAMQLNDDIHSLVKRYPSRFSGLATLATQLPLQAAEELQRAVVKLGLKGGIFFSHIKGEYLDDEKYWPIFEAASDLNVPLYLHPRGPSPSMVAPYLKYPVLEGATWGYAAEVGLHAMRLICSGVFDKYPNLKIILGHMGEGLPYWLCRIDKHWDKFPISKQLRKKPSQYVKDSFFITTSGMFYTPAFICAYLALGADKILFAVDYPFESIDEASHFAESLPISDADREKICGGNAERLFKLNG